MPVYTFENDAGETLDLIRPMSARDHGPAGWRRIITAGAIVLPKAPITQSDEVMAGCRAVESAVGTSEFERRMDGLKSRDIKRIWGK